MNANGALSLLSWERHKLERDEGSKKEKVIEEQYRELQLEDYI